MNKKRYQAPAVRKVRLVVKDSVLGTCHSSPILLVREPMGCRVNPVQCYSY